MSKLRFIVYRKKPSYSYLNPGRSNLILVKTSESLFFCIIRRVSSSVKKFENFSSIKTLSMVFFTIIIVFKVSDLKNLFSFG